VTPRAPTRANLRFTNEHFTLQIDPDTGLIDHFAPPRVRRSLLGPRAGAPALFRDLDHSWRCGTPGPGGDSDDLGPHGFHEDPLLLQLADAQQAHAIHPSHEHKYADGPEAGPPIRITEHGELQTMVEVLFVAGPTAVHRRYVVRHRDGLVEIRDRVWMNHRDHMLKLELPLARRPRELLADACYSAVTRTPDSEHQERPNGRWLAIDGLRDDPTRLAVLNSGSHAHACHDSSLYLACLRTPAYASFTIGPASDWHHACNRERMDLGEHELRFALALHAAPDEARIRREADLFNQPLSWQVFHPQPSRVARRIRKLAAGTVRVDDPAVQIVAVKRAQSGERLIVRLLETSGQPRQVRLHCSGGPAPRLHLPAHGLITVAIARQGSPRSQLVDLVERPETDAR
ncbi:MAG: glycoside hydrolase family 38 C-terminal domain-containing protein, partial [Planctomycetota bacterium]